MISTPSKIAAQTAVKPETFGGIDCQSAEPPAPQPVGQDPERREFDNAFSDHDRGGASVVLACASAISGAIVGALLTGHWIDLPLIALTAAFGVVVGWWARAFSVN